ncbi:hypothetical protein [Microbacterium dauci]|uniref:Bacteriophage HK97-gp10, tail-component n=1 Tax=Microbacterium dauci TaxID=3048008 RepID=A0ABT6ZGQ8_9MICO|nr:hypothetical protein [Microbacterium sp. LX3-4]MDJ1115345.1 hypothetical protein [Microbacterium sp. LX3-4]
MAAQYGVEGGRQLRKSLRAAGDNLNDLKFVHGRAAGIAATRTRQLVPTVSGRLAATIRAAGTKTAAIVRIGNNTKVRYAGPIHWGWPKRNIRPNPFASLGAQQSEPTWLPLYRRYIDLTLHKIKGL